MKPNDFAIRVANIVEALRDLRGVKQVELANALSIDISNYSRVENGHRPFDVAELETVAKKLRTTVLQIILLADTSIWVNNQLQPLSKILLDFVSNVNAANLNQVFTEIELKQLFEKLRNKQKN